MFFSQFCTKWCVFRGQKCLWHVLFWGPVYGSSNPNIGVELIEKYLSFMGVLVSGGNNSGCFLNGCMRFLCCFFAASY